MTEITMMIGTKRAYMELQEDSMKQKKVKINKEAKEYLLNYLQEWIDHFNRFPTSFRKGIVRAIYNKVDAMETE